MRTPNGSRRALAAAALVLLASAACSGGGDKADEAARTTTTEAHYPLDDRLRLNEIQALGTHNSYHVQADPKLFETLATFSAPLAESIEYSHPPLDQQFDEQGIRQIELDVWADPEGGHYAEPVLPTVLKLPPPDEPALAEPGFKVFHVQDVDFTSTCPTLVACLEVVKTWSDANPGHVPMMILVEAKDDPIDVDVDLGWTAPVTIGAAEVDALDAEIRSVFDPADLITPDEVRGKHETLEEAVLTDGWPTLGESRGKVLFALDNENYVRDAYLAGHPSLEGRVLFTSSPPGEPSAAFVKLNDPLKDDARIRDLVRKGYVIRTRADADTKETRTGDTAPRDAALASGAQWVSTDYPVADPRFDTGYVVKIPGGTPARCNPVSAPPNCTPKDIEDPAWLSG